MSDLPVKYENPLGVYVHIPFCKSKCKYCAFISASDLSLKSAYINALVREIRSCSASGAFVDTVYIGGGTPSCMERAELSAIFDALRATFVIDGSAEITVEMNPESCSEDFISECVSCGVNRVSMGLQSSNDDVLRAIGRIHTYSDFINAVERLQKNFDNISSDMILGLPNQDDKDVARTLDAIINNCTHASVYALAVENGTPLKKSGYSVNDDYVADLYDLAYERLYVNGFSRYEVSNFAKNDRKSRHNMKYWNCEGYLGFGVAAHGYDGQYIRYSHTEDIKRYIDEPKIFVNRLSEVDRYNEYVMLRLRTERGISLSDFENRLGYGFYSVNGNEQKIKRMSKDRLIIADDKNIRIAPKYMFVMNGIIEELMLDR